MIKGKLSKSEFETGRLSSSDAIDYMTGLRPNGKYGPPPQIDFELARSNYPHLFSSMPYRSDCLSTKIIQAENVVSKRRYGSRSKLTGEPESRLARRGVFD